MMDGFLQVLWVFHSALKTEDAEILSLDFNISFI